MVVTSANELRCQFGRWSLNAIPGEENPKAPEAGTSSGQPTPASADLRQRIASDIGKRFVRLDRNGDKRLSLSEFTGDRKKADAIERMRRLFHRLDRNSDRELTSAEFGAMAPSGKQLEKLKGRYLEKKSEQKTQGSNGSGYSPDLSMGLNMVAHNPICCVFGHSDDVMVYATLEARGGAWQARVSAAEPNKRQPRWTVYSESGLGLPVQGFGDTSHVACLAISPDDRTVALTMEDSFAVHLIDVHSGKVRNLSLRLSDGSVIPDADNHHAGSVDLSPDGRLLAVSPVSDEIDNYALLVDQVSGSIVGAIEHPDAVWQVRFSPSGNSLATMSSPPRGPTKVNLWSIRDAAAQTESAVALVRFEQKAKGLSIVPPGATEREFRRRLHDYATAVIHRGLDVKTVGPVTCPDCQGAGVVKDVVLDIVRKCHTCNGNRVLQKSIDTRTGVEMLD